MIIDNLLHMVTRRRATNLIRQMLHVLLEVAEARLPVIHKHATILAAMILELDASVCKCSYAAHIDLRSGERLALLGRLIRGSCRHLLELIVVYVAELRALASMMLRPLDFLVGSRVFILHAADTSINASGGLTASHEQPIHMTLTDEQLLDAGRLLS